MSEQFEHFLIIADRPLISSGLCPGSPSLIYSNVFKSISRTIRILYPSFRVTTSAREFASGRTPLWDFCPILYGRISATCDTVRRDDDGRPDPRPRSFGLARLRPAPTPLVPPRRKASEGNGGLVGALAPLRPRPPVRAPVPLSLPCHASSHPHLAPRGSRTWVEEDPRDRTGESTTQQTEYIPISQRDESVERGIGGTMVTLVTVIRRTVYIDVLPRDPADPIRSDPICVRARVQPGADREERSRR